MLGYFYILSAAIFWGGSAVLSKYMGHVFTVDALLLGGVVILGEHLGPWQIVGMALVLVAISVLELTSGRYRDS